MTEYLITTVAGGYDDGSNAKLTATLETLFNPRTAPTSDPAGPAATHRALGACGGQGPLVVLRRTIFVSGTTP
jgi:hypothetical protein